MNGEMADVVYALERAVRISHRQMDKQRSGVPVTGMPGWEWEKEELQKLLQLHDCWFQTQAGGSVPDVLWQFRRNEVFLHFRVIVKV